MVVRGQWLSEIPISLESDVQWASVRNVPTIPIRVRLLNKAGADNTFIRDWLTALN